MVRAAMDAAMNGLATVPTALIRARPSSSVRAREIIANVDIEKRGWLEALSNGISTAQLAGQIGFSEREMYRRLRDLYGRMGVRNRTEALVWATYCGIIQPSQ